MGPRVDRFYNLIDLVQRKMGGHRCGEYLYNKHGLMEEGGPPNRFLSESDYIRKPISSSAAGALWTFHCKRSKITPILATWGIMGPRLKACSSKRTAHRREI